MKTVQDAMYYIKNTAFLGGPDTDADLREAVGILEKELDMLGKAKNAFTQYVENDYEAAEGDYCREALAQVGCDREMLEFLGLDFLAEEDA